MVKEFHNLFTNSPLDKNSVNLNMTVFIAEFSFCRKNNGKKQTMVFTITVVKNMTKV